MAVAALALGVVRLVVVRQRFAAVLVFLFAWALIGGVSECQVVLAALALKLVFGGAYARNRRYSRRRQLSVVRWSTHGHQDSELGDEYLYKLRCACDAAQQD